MHLHQTTFHKYPEVVVYQRPGIASSVYHLLAGRHSMADDVVEQVAPGRLGERIQKRGREERLVEVQTHIKDKKEPTIIAQST